MTKRKAVQSPVNRKDVLPGLIRKGNLRLGCPLGCIVNGKLLEVGIASKEGIQCCCGCLKKYSMSHFEEHVGSKQKRGSKTMFLLDGSIMSDGSFKTLADLKAEINSSSVSDEAEPSSHGTRRTLEQKNSFCNFCLTEGEVIRCTTPSCPAGLHVQCSAMQDSSNGQWYCQKCRCRSCEASLRGNDTNPPNMSFRELFCSLCGDEYHMKCVADSGRLKFGEDLEWLCSEYCEKVSYNLTAEIKCNDLTSITSMDGFIMPKAFEILQETVQISLKLSNSLTMTLVRWTGNFIRVLNNDEPESSSSLLYTLKQKSAEAKQLYYALNLLKSSFKDEIRVNNQTGLFQKILYPANPDDKPGPTPESRCLDHYGFYAVLLEKDAIVMTVATIRIHSQEVAEMPFITTSEAHRGKGFCRKLMQHLKRMLERIGVRKLVVQSPPEFVAMWVSKYSLHRVDGDARRSLLKCNLLQLEGTTLLCKIIQREEKTHEQSTK